MDAIKLPERPMLPMREQIGPDRRVSIRPIERTDAAALSDFYARLSPESRRRRFLSCGTAPPAAAIARLATADGFVAVLNQMGPDDGAIVAHASIQPDGRGGAEVAFAVADAWQGRGIGRRLVELAIGRARRLGLARATATMLAENAPMRHLLCSVAPVAADHLDAGTEEIVLDLAA